MKTGPGRLSARAVQIFRSQTDRGLRSAVAAVLLVLGVAGLGSSLGGSPFLGDLTSYLLSGSTRLKPVVWIDADSSKPVAVPHDLPSDPYSSSQPGKLAFLFLTRGPLPLAPLWARFFLGHGHRMSIYIHASDPSWRYTTDNVPPVFRGRQVPGEPVRWGEISMVDAERRLLASALRDPHNLFFVLASESCIPLWPFPYVYNYLLTSPVSFVEVFDCPLNIGYGRYNKEMAPVVPKEEFRKGSQWFAMQRRHAQMVVSDTMVYSSFKKYCLRGEEHRNCYSDEHYIPTLLHMKDAQGLANYSVTFADWSARQWHPSTFIARNTTARELRMLKNEKHFIRWRSYWFRVRQRQRNLVIENKTDRPLQVPDNGVCKIGKKAFRCFLFARKFHQGTLPFLIKHASSELGF